MLERKVCEVCGAEFETNRGAKACSPECRTKRRRIVCKQYNQEHKEWYNQYHRKYFQEKTKAKRREQYRDPESAYRKYKDTHREEHNKQRRLRYAENSEAIREYNRKYKAEHSEAFKEYGRKYRDKNRDVLNVKMRKRTHLAKLSTLPQTVIEVGGNQVVLYECSRLRIKGTTLPCGDRWECWFKGKCKLVPRGKREITFDDATTPQFNQAV